MGDKEDRISCCRSKLGVERFQEETPLNARGTVTFPDCDLGVVNNGTGIQCSASLVLCIKIFSTVKIKKAATKPGEVPYNLQIKVGCKYQAFFCTTTPFSVSLD